MFEIIKVIILGIVEGITEWLPISSTGHLVLVEEFIKLEANESFKEMFNVVIQLGAILAVLVLYWNKLNPFSARKTERQKKLTLDLWKKVIIACLPAAVLGLLFDDWMDAHFHNWWVISIMLILYGFIFIKVEEWNETNEPKVNRLTELSYKTALLIGAFQVLSLIPGTSRSGVTIVGALLLGVSRYVAAEFTFFLAIPVMFGASGLKLLKFFMEGPGMSAGQFGLLMLGCVVAFFVSIIAIKFLMGYIKKHDFKVFGKYRIVLGIIVIVYFLIAGMI